MRVTILGSGTSSGVPRIGNDWGDCDPSEPKNRRRRVSLLVEHDGATIVIDTGPDFREQMLAANIQRLDAVLYTHDHADHTHGIDDLRAFTNRRREALPLYGPADSLARMAEKFRYIFDDAIRPLPGTSKPQGHAIPVEPGVPFTVGDLEIIPAVVPHGEATVFAYRIGPLAYVTDAKSIPAAAMDVLRGARVLVINALFMTGHPTHLSIPEALSAARAIGADRTFLTHLTHNMSHATLSADLPPGIAPAYDGLTIEIA